MNSFSDSELNKRILDLQSAIQAWAEERKLWDECGFQSYQYRNDAEPTSPAVITVMWYTSVFSDVFNGQHPIDYESEFMEFLSSLGYDYEPQDNISLHIYARDEQLNKAYEDYFHWQWVCSLIQDDCDDVYHELYEYFEKHPDRMQNLHWREYETLLFRVFQSQGFQAELGPGRGDGGVDIKLLQKDPMGDILTLVQAKKYAPRRKIGLEAVAALHGIRDVNKAQNSIFVTTSEYAPAAREFAARTSNKLTLYTSSDIASWCKDASRGIIQDKTKLMDRSVVKKIIFQLFEKRDSRLVHASYGYNMIWNNFAIVLKETKYAALLMNIRDYNVSDDGYGQRGTQAPLLNEDTIANFIPDSVWRAKRKEDDSGQITYWDGEKLYTPWSGEPVVFDYVD